MLKNKKALILIVINVVIWSFFIYKFYTAYNAYNDVEVAPNVNIAGKAVFSKDSVDYKLNLAYKDPFLKGEIKNMSAPAANMKPVQKSPKTETIRTPTVTSKPVLDIKYLGLIKNSSNGVATALISVGGQSRFVKVNDVVEGITIKKIDNTQLEGSAGKEKVIIRR